MRKRSSYQRVHQASGAPLLHALQSQAAHAGVSSRRLARAERAEARVRELEQEVAQLRSELRRRVKARSV
jgi:hypothetical protein